MAQANTIREPSHSHFLVSAAIVVGALYFGRDILLPFALSILLSFLLAPLSERLEQWRFGRIPAVLTVVTTAFIGVVMLGSILANQVYDLAYKLPDYQQNILAKAQSFQGDETGVLARVRKSIEEMQATLSATATEDSSAAQPRSNATPESILLDGSHPTSSDPKASGGPIAVEVVETLSAKEIAQGILGPLISPLASAAMVLVFVIFMLLKREDLRNRLIFLIGGDQLNVTTQALNDAARRVSRYLLMQLIINSSYGVVICIGLLLIGLPNAVLWGALTAVLRFVPYVGPWIAAIMPIAISLAVFDGWLQPGLIIALFVVNELISNNIIEPWLYGSNTGISTIGILASAVFWTWLWGPLGLVMATPLTVCLTVVGRYVPQLAFFNTILSDQDTLPPQSRFYQRLLALDSEEAMEVAEDYLATSSLSELYDTVILPALYLAERDRHHGQLDEIRQLFVHKTTREIVEDLGERVSNKSAEHSLSSGHSEPPAVEQSKPILCLPARDEADEIAGVMLTQLLEQRGVPARVVSTEVLIGEMLEQVDVDAPAIVCVSALPPLATTHARYLCKRLRSKFPELKVIVGLWQTRDITEKTRARLGATGVNSMVTTLGEAAVSLERLSLQVPQATMSATT